VELTGTTVILTLKIAVIAVTVILLASLTAVARGHYRLHGRLNLVFFVLTLTALVALEVVVRLIRPDIFEYFEPDTHTRLLVHLCFSIPAACVMPVMLWSGREHRRRLHLTLAWLFGVLWIGTFVTGVFFLPHQAP
jgi:uncharacterized membrane protein YozB (DUF420 family)